MSDYVIGIDFGTSSVRAVVVDTANGEEQASSEFEYPRFKAGRYVDAAKNQFRQHPLDYLEGLEATVKGAVQQVPADVRNAIKAISVDTTGSTPVAVDQVGVPLALKPQFAENPNAMFVLWKDHTAAQEAEEINTHVRKSDVDYLKYSGGIYSSEWFWSKLLHILRVDEAVRAECHSWVEHCDWMPFLLTGGTDISQMKRSVCAAGHKAMWAEEFGGLPSENFLSSLDPLLSGFRDRLYEETYTSDQSVGVISAEWAQKLGLPETVQVGVGALDAHMGAVGGQIEPYFLSKVMGTSTCDMLAVPRKELGDKLIKGICGQVNGSIIPGMIGLEAGQSAFGDVYAWFKELIAWPIAELGDNLPEHTKKELTDGILRRLNEAADQIPLTTDLELAVDWLNGRRTPDTDLQLKGALMGLSLGSNAPRVYRALAEATCFGAKAIVDRFVSEGIPVKGIVAVGGVARKSPFILQMLADILQMPICVHRADQTCAHGASMFAATVAGVYPDVLEAMQHMGNGFDKNYEPNPSRGVIYAERYQKYLRLGEAISAKA